MTYYYRVPEDEYETIAGFLMAASTAEERDVNRIASLPQLGEFFRIAFDEMEGRDEKLQALAVRVAVRVRADSFLREVLLDSTLEEFCKINILHALTMRNEEDSFGVVVCNVYKEFFTHKIEIGEKKAEAFLKAFADVYSKFALLARRTRARSARRRRTSMPRWRKRTRSTIATNAPRLRPRSTASPASRGANGRSPTLSICLTPINTRRSASSTS